MKKINQKILTFFGIENTSIARSIMKFTEVGLVFAMGLFVWELLKLLMQTEGPVVVVMSGSMEPGFSRGDILFISNRNHHYKSGQIVVFKTTQQNIPVVHRIISVFTDANGKEKILTKGDFNKYPDQSLYDHKNGQYFLEQEHIHGVIWGYIPKIGSLSLLANEKNYFKPIGFILIAILGFFGFE
eukprot:Anaeramoba_ignava/a226754_25.p1 GENE.a226754_25~~a226754_25.p1  ORF type:complete len:185 (+),score=38.05 a226754_25:270-824(+)